MRWRACVTNLILDCAILLDKFRRQVLFVDVSILRWKLIPSITKGTYPASPLKKKKKEQQKEKCTKI